MGGRYSVWMDLRSHDIYLYILRFSLNLLAPDPLNVQFEEVWEEPGVHVCTHLQKVRSQERQNWVLGVRWAGPKLIIFDLESPRHGEILRTHQTAR